MRDLRNKISQADELVTVRRRIKTLLVRICRNNPSLPITPLVIDQYVENLPFGNPSSVNSFCNFLQEIHNMGKFGTQESVEEFMRLLTLLSFPVDAQQASPQVEQGFTSIANEIVEALARINISPYEYRVLWALWRKTYGWHRTRTEISVTLFMMITGLDRRHISRTIDKLIERRIVVAHRGTVRTVNYGFNKDYTKWKDVACRGTGSKIVAHRGTGSSPIEATTKYIKEKTFCANFPEDSDQIRLSHFLLSKIRARKADFKPSFNKKDFQMWGKHIDFMICKDGRDPVRIQEVIEWCQQDIFWQNNILSTGKLREQFDQLELKMAQVRDIQDKTPTW